MSITSGLIFYMPFDELSGNPKDLSGSGLDGTATGTTAGADGKIYLSREMGTNEYVTISANSIIGNLTSSFTIASWFYVANLAGTPNAIWDTAESPSGTLGFALILVDGTGRLTFTTKGVKDYGFTTLAITNSATWYHVAVILDASFDATLYLNGINRETITHTVGANANTTQATFIGASPDNTATPTRNYLPPGRIDDFRIYNRELSAAEINQVYTFGGVRFKQSMRPRPFGPGLAR